VIVDCDLVRDRISRKIFNQFVPIRAHLSASYLAGRSGAFKKRAARARALAHTNTRFRVPASTQTDAYVRLLLDVRNQGAQYSWNIVARTWRVGEVQISLAPFVFVLHPSAARSIQKYSLPQISEATARRCARQARRKREHLNSRDPTSLPRLRCRACEKEF